MRAKIPEVNMPRVVIVGGGFAGLTLLRKLRKKNFQIVLIDQFNYHQFQPLFYQVATSGLEPSSISFPFRKIFQSRKNIFIRITHVTSINTAAKRVNTEIGHVNYDYLVIATGVETNYFGNERLREKSFPMKSVPEALLLRNTLLQNLEAALITDSADEKEGLLNLVIIGGGPTGVELSGAIAEMKKFILPKDYPELDFNQMNIYLVEAQPKVLSSMSDKASQKVYEYLIRLGVKVLVNTRVNDYDGKNISLGDNKTIRTNTMIWTAGVSAAKIDGLPSAVYGRGGRIFVNEFNTVQGFNDIFALGDIALMTNIKHPAGHPQVAQVAIQQAQQLAKNFCRMQNNEPLLPFEYHDKGSMATVGRNLAVADLKGVSLHGFVAWLIWMFIHLVSLIGFKNKVIIFINWIWNYITYDQSLRLIIKPKQRPAEVKQVKE
jgi:NADH dehydrogenase